MSQLAVKSNQERRLIPRRRAGTKTFLDVPRELREKDFRSQSGQYFMRILPPDVSEHFKKAILETGIQGEDALEWLEYALSEDGKGKPVSPIAQWTHDNPFNPRAFKYIYREADPLSAMDQGYNFTTGAQAIYLRLQSLIKRLPGVIYSERKRFGLGPKERYVIYNIGSAYSLDTIYMISQNPELRNLVQVVCVDPDKESLDYGQRLAKKLGIAECFKFIARKVKDTELEQAHMILFIGMFCPVPTKICVLTLNFIKKHVKENGIVIFSTVQEKMLMGGPILDFIMWTYGWRMYFKADDEPGKMATSAGYKHEKRMDWEDDYGYNRMTVARKPKTSFLRVISNTAKQIKLLLF